MPGWELQEGRKLDWELGSVLGFPGPGSGALFSQENTYCSHLKSEEQEQ